jgi:hypothetical protein
MLRIQGKDLALKYRVHGTGISLGLSIVLRSARLLAITTDKGN